MTRLCTLRVGKAAPASPFGTKASHGESSLAAARRAKNGDSAGFCAPLRIRARDVDRCRTAANGASFNF
jgi:hypothetical protein